MEENQTPKVTRNQFLKFLAATGSATVAAAFLPEKWIKPIMNVGVLPAHAESSLPGVPVTIGNLNFKNEIGMNSGKGRGLASLKKLPEMSPSPDSSYSIPLSASFVYSDKNAGVTTNAHLYLSVNSNWALNGQTIGDQHGSVTGTTNGTVTFYLNAPSTLWPNALFCVGDANGSLYMITTDDRTSNPISGTMPMPPC